MSVGSPFGGLVMKRVTGARRKMGFRGLKSSISEFKPRFRAVVSRFGRDTGVDNSPRERENRAEQRAVDEVADAEDHREDELADDGGERQQRHRERLGADGVQPERQE